MLIGTPVLALGAVDAFADWKVLLAGPAAGAVADLLIRRLRPGPERPWSLRAVGGAVPVVLWLAFFALFDATRGLGWEPELWAGVTFMAALAGAGLALLVAPPAMPARPARPASEDG